MAFIDNKDLKPGRYGNVIVYMSNGRKCIRMVPEHVNNPKTSGQVMQREKFTKAQAYARSLLPLINEGWKEMAVGKYADNAATSYLMKNAFIVDGEEVILDETKILHAKGTLLKEDNLKANDIEGQKVLYSWEDNSGIKNAKDDDEFCCVCVNMDDDKKVYCFTKAKRNDKSYIYQLPEGWKGKRAAVYGFFRSRDGKRVSDDKYLGTITLM